MNRQNELTLTAPATKSEESCFEIEANEMVVVSCLNQDYLTNSVNTTTLDFSGLKFLVSGCY